MSNKITVTIDMDDIYSEEGEEINVNDLIKSAITQEVSGQLRLVIKENINQEILKKVDINLKSIAHGELERTIKAKLTEEFISLEVSDRYDGSNKRSVIDHIANEINRLTGSHLTKKLNDLVVKQTKEAVSRLQNQYNSAFASSVINKLYENDFLSEKAITAIMDKTSE